MNNLAQIARGSANRLFLILSALMVAAMSFAQTTPTEPDMVAVVQSVSNKLGGSLAGYLPHIGTLFAIVLGIGLIFKLVRKASKA